MMVYGRVALLAQVVGVRNKNSLAQYPLLTAQPFEIERALGIKGCYERASNETAADWGSVLPECPSCETFKKKPVTP
jgi:hypothetical protein